MITVVRVHSKWSFGLVRSALTLNLNCMSFRLYCLVRLAACSDCWWDSALCWDLK